MSDPLINPIITVACAHLGGFHPSLALREQLEEPMLWASLTLLYNCPRWAKGIDIFYNSIIDRGTVAVVYVRPLSQFNYGPWTDAVTELFSRLTRDAPVLGDSLSWFKLVPQNALKVPPRQQIVAWRNLSRWLERKWPEGSNLLQMPVYEPIELTQGDIIDAK